MTQLPKDPPPGLLMSMAIRYDHGLGCAGYYDQPLFGATEPGAHKRRLESTLSIMRQLYEEVSGHGFYQPNLEENYVEAMKWGLVEKTLDKSSQDNHHA